ncbi:MAG TPA: nitroreductase family protein [Prolixibacteraceae bacterium]|jgi:nitroreductase|nr:nitroreductase family protein [Prolixibacteraceae bacterium]
MDFAELVKKRQSDRKYAVTPVEEGKIAQCIESARLSPSSNNSQPWKFIVVDEPSLIEQVAQCADSLGMNKFTHQVPVIVAVVIERQNLLSSAGSLVQQKDYSLIDVGMAVNQFCLQAADLGLGTCIIGWFDEKKLKKILGVPRSLRLPLLISLGYSEASPRTKVRKPTEKMSSRNHY